MAARSIQVIGPVAFVPLTQGRAAMIDAVDVHLVDGVSWGLKRGPWACYAFRTGPRPGKFKFYLHRVLLGLGHGDKRHADHVNGNGLDNRRCNLRVCSNRQNQMNQRPQRGRTSGYKGVYFHRRTDRWRASIGVYRRILTIGDFRVEEDAARAYDRAAIKHYGEYALTNFPVEEYTNV